MNAVIGSVRALLRDFANSPWGQCHARTPTWEVYFNRTAGRANPMAMDGGAGSEPAQVPQPALATAMAAPHLGLFEPLVASGAVVARGEPVAQLRVLDRTTPVLADAGGSVELLAGCGELVEFGGALLRIHSA